MGPLPAGSFLKARKLRPAQRRIATGKVMPRADALELLMITEATDALALLQQIEGTV